MFFLRLLLRRRRRKRREQKEAERAAHCHNHHHHCQPLPPNNPVVYGPPGAQAPTQYNNGQQPITYNYPSSQPQNPVYPPQNSMNYPPPAYSKT